MSTASARYHHSRGNTVHRGQRDELRALRQRGHRRGQQAARRHRGRCRCRGRQGEDHRGVAAW